MAAAPVAAVLSRVPQRPAAAARRAGSTDARTSNRRPPEAPPPAPGPVAAADWTALPIAPAVRSAPAGLSFDSSGWRPASDGDTGGADAPSGSTRTERPALDDALANAEGPLESGTQRGVASLWSAAADAGIAVGRGSQKAAGATSRGFTRLGKKFAAGF
jgi:hypothetical protein